MRITYQINPHVATSIDVRPWIVTPEVPIEVHYISADDVKGLFDLFVDQECTDPLDLTPGQQHNLLTRIVQIETHVREAHMTIAAQFEAQSREQESAK